ncbi:hypothetical protein [Kutzneria buriramensis]|uniref:Uncharacterized protein n=1 Tax=Kutzneria buriramensis TaxID=1045776 RepID=A0A3E0GV36_9PSEU|nr:hypothetical protein [Kutzneria buriramensis]REH28624.1 hypothetical protein BCF44_12666 [Kutzneria buriramensis]
MHRPNLTRRIAALRHAYTGETDATLIPAAQAAACGFSPQQRDLVSSILDGDWGARLLGHPEPIIDTAIRSPVLLDTTVHPQHELDAAVLLALGRAHTYYGHSRALPQRTLCRMVRPTRDELVLALFPQTLATVLAELLPHERDGQLLGLAGLRLRLHRRHAELYLADADPTVRVAVSNTSFRQAAAAMAFATAHTGCATTPHDEPAPLSELEELAIGLGRVPGPIALASALLRRAGLFADADWVAIEAVGSNCLRIDWYGGPTPAHVAALLTHPVAGLPENHFNTVTTPDGTIALTCRDFDGAVSLRQRTGTAPHPHMTAAWAAYRNVMTASNPDSLATPSSHARQRTWA